MTGPGPRPPALTIVVAVTSGSPYLEDCLAALEQQSDPPELEIVVPVDDSLNDAERWAREHPAVRFPRREERPMQATANAAAQRHLAYDRRRAAGIAAARAPVVALTEDHAIPAPDWCRRIDAAHRAQPHAAIGGAIGNGNHGAIARATCLCDFDRYAPPLSAGPADALSDVNVSYKRERLDAVGERWREAYHETAVHGALRNAGETLWLDPEILVEQRRGPLALGASLRERYAWGRLYAGKRTREIGRARHLSLALLAPLLPGLLSWRQLRRALRRKDTRALALLPCSALLLCAWSLGEAVGYWTGRPVGGLDEA